jgi:hypothetical protein
VSGRQYPWDAVDLIGIFDNDNRSRQPAGRGVIVVEGEVSLHWGSGRPDLELAGPIKGLTEGQVEVGWRKERLERSQAARSSGILLILLIL